MIDAKRLRSRWVIVPGGLVLFTVLWLVYVSLHNHGLLEGSVVDANGKPVAGAKVSLFERGFVTHEEKASATTGADGRFRFDNNPSHSVQLEAVAPELGRTNRQIVRLWFAAQDRALAEPLRFAKAQ
jgi:hypothetical protein